MPSGVYALVVGECFDRKPEIWFSFEPVPGHPMPLLQVDVAAYWSMSAAVEGSSFLGRSPFSWYSGKTGGIKERIPALKFLARCEGGGGLGKRGEFKDCGEG